VIARKKRHRRYDVAFYVPWVGPLLTAADTLPNGGAETQIFLLARALAARGVRVCLIAFDVPNVAIPSLVDGVHVSLRPRYRSHERLGKIREVFAMWKAISGVDAEVLVTRAAGPHVGLTGLFAKLSGMRFVYSSANISDFDFSRLESSRRNQALFRQGLRLANLVVVQSEEQGRMCEERFDRPAVLVRSIAEPAPPRVRKPEAFLWIGRLVWYKRPLAFIELARAIPEARFWMVAVPVLLARDDPELGTRLEKRAASVRNLELLPPTPRPRLMELVDRAVAIVNTADFEGMPNVFLEGWARGVPAVALNHDPDGVIERHRLGAFAHGSHERLVQLVRRLWEERDDQADLAEACRRYVLDHHSPEALGQRWQEVLGVRPGAHSAEQAPTS
jgi:glycosyltransferase involved in cell wall biosynthesis